jgi:hypothetical protein
MGALGGAVPKVLAWAFQQAKYFQFVAIACILPRALGILGDTAIMQRVEKAAGNRSVASTAARTRRSSSITRARSERQRGCPSASRRRNPYSCPIAAIPNESPFCALMAKTNRSCAACLQMQRRIELSSPAWLRKSLRCFAGLCDSAVPVRVGENVVAFLTTGPGPAAQADPRAVCQDNPRRC